MNARFQSDQGSLAQLQRETYFWRFVALLTIVCGILAASPQSQKEIRLTSADGKNTVILSAEGLTLQSGGRQLARLAFETVGDGDEQIAFLKMNGEIAVDSGVIALTDGKQRALLRANSFSQNQDGIVRITITPGRISLGDAASHAKAELTADEQGMSGLALLYDHRLIAELGSSGIFHATDPPKRDSASLLLNDFGAHFKSRLITPSEDTVRGK